MNTSSIVINGIPIDKATLLTLVANNKKIQAIKFIRDHVKLSLKECKDIVDNLEHNPKHYANDIITVSKPIALEDIDHKRTSSRPKRGSHFIKNKASKNKNYIIILLLGIIAILLYYISSR